MGMPQSVPLAPLLLLAVAGARHIPVGEGLHTLKPTDDPAATGDMDLEMHTQVRELRTYAPEQRDWQKWLAGDVFSKFLTRQGPTEGGSVRAQVRPPS